MVEKREPQVRHAIRGKYVTGWLVYEFDLTSAGTYNVIIGHNETNTRLDASLGYKDYADAGEELRRLVEAWDNDFRKTGESAWKAH